MNKKDLRLQAKPWITPGILKSIKRRDKLLRKYIQLKEPIRKTEVHSQYKALKKQIIAIIRQSKKNHFQNYFNDNAEDIRKTWIGIKNIINIRSINSNQPTNLI